VLVLEAPEILSGGKPAIRAISLRQTRNAFSPALYDAGNSGALPAPAPTRRSPGADGRAQRGIAAPITSTSNLRVKSTMRLVIIVCTEIKPGGASELLHVRKLFGFAMNRGL